MAMAANVVQSADRQMIDRVYPQLCDLVDRQRAAVAAEVPEMADDPGLRSIEVWFLWGAINQLVGEDAEQTQDVLAYYLHHRRLMPVDRARQFAETVARDVTERNPLVDGMALAGQEAIRIGVDCGFVAGARFLQQAMTR